MSRMRCAAGAVMLAVGSVGFGLFAVTASAQAGGGTGTAHASTSTSSTVTSGGGTSAAPAPVPRNFAPAQAPAGDVSGNVVGAANAGGSVGSGSSNQVQVIVGNKTGPCSPIVAQQVNNSNNTAANNNGSANNSPALNVSSGQSSAPGNGRGVGDIGKNNGISQSVNVNCFNNSSPQTVTRTVIVPQTVTRTVVVPAPVVQQAPVAAPVVTRATFTG